MMMNILLICVSALAFASAQDVKVKFLPAEFSVLGGTNLTYHCMASSDQGIPQVAFVRKSTKESWDVDNTTEPGRIFVTTEEFTANNSVKLSLIFQPVLPSDQYFYDCIASFLTVKKASQIDLFVLPGETVPKIKMNETAINSTVLVGDSTVIDCNAVSHFPVAKSAPNIPALELMWYFSETNGTLGSVLTNNDQYTIVSTKKEEGPTGNFTYTVLSDLTIKSATFENYGYYTCRIKLKWSVHADFYFKEFKLLSVSGHGSTSSSSREEKVKAGSNAVLLCKVDTRPPSTSVWKKDGEEITFGSGSRYRLSNDSNQINNVLTISDVTYTDRGVYQCHASSKFTNNFISIRLRVRDPIGAVWPFIGIIIETIILVIIIAAYEAYKKSHKKKKRSDTADGVSPADRKETSPLLPKSGEPGVAYSGEPGAVTLTAVSNPVA